MYYQVGNKCLTEKEAEKLYFSLVIHVIRQDGRVIKPEYNGKVWKVADEEVKAYLPECSPMQNFNSGAEIGWMVFGVMAALFYVAVIKRLLK